jgi:peptide/nickel transport system substrate-binding protein
VAENPAHHRYWFPRVDGMISLYPSSHRKPLDDVRVRKALSLAIDRELLVQVAMYGYTGPADATGLDDGFASWRDPVAPEDQWTRHDPAAAERLLDEAGCTRPRAGAVRRCAGAPMELTLLTVSGWSDWVRAGQVVARNLAAIGVTVRVRTYDFAAWFNRLQRGEFDLSIAWTEPGANPYPVYRALMSSQLVQPVGEPAPRNWHRFGDAEADAALAAFERTLDPVEQRRLASVVQRRFVALAPVIPLFPSPSWAAFNTSRITGFPEADNAYSRPTPNKMPECLLVLTHLTPRAAAPAPQQAAH